MCLKLRVVLRGEGSAFHANLVLLWLMTATTAPELAIHWKERSAENGLKGMTRIWTKGKCWRPINYNGSQEYQLTYIGLIEIHYRTVELPWKCGKALKSSALGLKLQAVIHLTEHRFHSSFSCEHCRSSARSVYPVPGNNIPLWDCNSRTRAICLVPKAVIPLWGLSLTPENSILKICSTISL